MKAEIGSETTAAAARGIAEREIPWPLPIPMSATADTAHRLSKEAGRQARRAGVGRMMERNAAYRVLIHLKEAKRTEQDVYRSGSQLRLKHNELLRETDRFKKDIHGQYLELVANAAKRRSEG